MPTIRSIHGLGRSVHQSIRSVEEKHAQPFNKAVEEVAKEIESIRKSQSDEFKLLDNPKEEVQVRFIVGAMPKKYQELLLVAAQRQENKGSRLNLKA